MTGRPHRDVRASLAVVDAPTAAQMWAAARTLARSAVARGASAAELRAVVEAIGFNPTRPPRPQISAAPHARDAQDTRPAPGEASRRSEAAGTAIPDLVDQPAEEPTP